MDQSHAELFAEVESVFSDEAIGELMVEHGFVTVSQIVEELAKVRDPFLQQLVVLHSFVTVRVFDEDGPQGEYWMCTECIDTSGCDDDDCTDCEQCEAGPRHAEWPCRTAMTVYRHIKDPFGGAL